MNFLQPTAQMSAIEYLSLYKLGTQISLRRGQSPKQFLEVVWDAGNSTKLINVRELQAASELWLQTRIKNLLCRKN